jgi:hypothetical protein
MASVYCDKKGVLMVRFMKQGTTTTSKEYCKTTKKTALGRPFRIKGMEC